MNFKISGFDVFLDEEKSEFGLIIKKGSFSKSGKNYLTKKDSSFECLLTKKEIKENFSFIVSSM